MQRHLDGKHIKPHEDKRSSVSLTAPGHSQDSTTTIQLHECDMAPFLKAGEKFLAEDRPETLLSVQRGFEKLTLTKLEERAINSLLIRAAYFKSYNIDARVVVMSFDKTTDPARLVTNNLDLRMVLEPSGAKIEEIILNENNELTAPDGRNIVCKSYASANRSLGDPHGSRYIVKYGPAVLTRAKDKQNISHEDLFHATALWIADTIAHKVRQGEDCGYAMPMPPGHLSKQDWDTRLAKKIESACNDKGAPVIYPEGYKEPEAKSPVALPSVSLPRRGNHTPATPLTIAESYQQREAPLIMQSAHEREKLEKIRLTRQEEANLKALCLLTQEARDCGLDAYVNIRSVKPEYDQAGNLINNNVHADIVFALPGEEIPPPDTAADIKDNRLICRASASTLEDLATIFAYWPRHIARKSLRPQLANKIAERIEKQEEPGFTMRLPANRLAQEIKRCCENRSIHVAEVMAPRYETPKKFSLWSWFGANPKKALNPPELTRDEKKQAEKDQYFKQHRQKIAETASRLSDPQARKLMESFYKAVGFAEENLSAYGFYKSTLTKPFNLVSRSAEAVINAHRIAADHPDRSRLIEDARTALADAIKNFDERAKYDHASEVDTSMRVLTAELKHS